jgi:hypothetical protein
MTEEVKWHKLKMNPKTHEFEEISKPVILHRKELHERFEAERRAYYRRRKHIGKWG